MGLTKGKCQKTFFVLTVLVLVFWPQISSASLVPNSYLEAESSEVEQIGGTREETQLNFWGNGWWGTTVEILTKGQYRFFFRGSGTDALDPSGERYPKVQISLNENRIGTAEVVTLHPSWGVYFSTMLELEPGQYKVRFTFDNDYGDGGGDRNVFVDWFGLAQVATKDEIPNLEVASKPLDQWGQFYYAYRPTATNQIANSSFEVASDWTQFCFSGTAQFNTSDSAEALFGNRSASITHPTGEVILNYYISIDPNQSYVLSGWIKTEFHSPGMNASLRGYFFDKFSNATKFVKAEPILTNNNGWTFVTLTIPADQLPKSTTYAYIACSAQGNEGAEGVAYFDGISFSPVNALLRPAKPLLRSDYLNGQVCLSWNPSEDPLTGYFLYEGSVPRFQIDYGEFVTTTLDSQFITKKAEELKYYKLVVIDKNYIPSLPSNEVKSDEVLPNPVGEVAVDHSQNGVVILSWQVPAAAIDGDLPTRYVVYRAKNEGSVLDSKEFFELKPGDRGFSAATGDWVEVWYSAPGGEKYYYGVVTFDAAGNRSVLSEIVAAEVAADSTPPLAPAVETTKGYVTKGPVDEPLPRGLVLLQWQELATAASDGDWARYYLIYRSEGGNPQTDGILLGKVWGTEQPNQLLEYRDLTATGGSTYYYQIVAEDKAGNKADNGKLISVKPLKPLAAALVAPAAGSAIVKAATTDSVTLTWLHVIPQADEVASYQVEYSQDSNFNVLQKHTTFVVAGDTVSSTLSLDQFTNGIWYWRVKTIFSSGVTSYSEANQLVVIQTSMAKSELGLISFASFAPQVLTGRNQGELCFVVKKEAQLSVRIYDTRGKQVKELMRNQWVQPGTVTNLDWDGTDHKGKKVPNGLYFIQLRANTTNEPDAVVVTRVQVYSR